MSHNRRRKDREPCAYWMFSRELTSKFIEQSGNKGNAYNDTMVGLAEYHDSTGEYDSDVFMKRQVG